MIRFRSKYRVDKDTGCWNWNRPHPDHGYGQFNLDGKTLRAHRVSWIIHNGTIPDGLCVLHKCDNPRCVNPSHLFLGTHSDNMIDMWKKGRQSPNSMPPDQGPQDGENNNNAVLTESLVREMKRLYKPRVFTYKMIAEMFSLPYMTVYCAVRGINWSNV